MQMLDAQTVSLIGNETLAINSRVYEAVYPSFNYSELLYVDAQGGEWANGIQTWFTDHTGKGKWQSLGAKDVPVVEVNQNVQTRYVKEWALGYDWHIGEVQRVANLRAPAEIFNVVERRARAARTEAERGLYELVIKGDADVGMEGMINYSGVPLSVLPADGADNTSVWVKADGTGNKTPAQIVRDVNILLSGVNRSTVYTMLANTLLLPHEALDYIASTPYSLVSSETILSFIGRTNKYTLETRQELRIRAVRDLSTGNAAGTGGRAVAYYNAPEYVKLHLNMPFRFMPIYQSGPFQFAVPGLMRSGGVEFLAEEAVRYGDTVSEPPTAP